MYHYRVELNGTPRPVSQVVRELDEPKGCTSFITAREEGLEFWEELSLRHPKVKLVIRWFEDLGHEYTWTAIENGESSVISSQPLLPKRWAAYCDGPALRMAARRVLERRRGSEINPYESGLGTALTVGKAFGQLCSQADEGIHSDPSPVQLDAVTDLAVAALYASTSGTFIGERVAGYEHALRLTRAMIGVSASQWRGWETDRWIRPLLEDSIRLIDLATRVRLERGNGEVPLDLDHECASLWQVESAATRLLTTCLTALAFFDRFALATYEAV
jgi:hypothetical protein